MHAGMSTANAVNPINEVTNQAQAVSGRRISDMPLQRISSVVVMKLREPSSWPMQKMAMEAIQRTTPQPWPGPAAAPIAFSGAYCVQPPSVGPSETKKDETATTNATNVTQNDIMLKCGKGMSSAPVWMGRKKFPKAAKGAVVRTKKTMKVACMVIIRRYSSGVMT